MKKIAFIIAALSLVCSACSDFLDRGPEDELSPASFWKTEADATLALTGCYSFMETNSFALYWDAASDNAFSFHRFAGWQVFGNGEMSPGETQMKNFMDYTGIHACNEYLANEQTVEFTTPGLRERYRAEVRFIRAYAYFVKSQVYGAVPFYTENFETPEEARIGRTPREEVERFILTELAEIVSALPGKSESGDAGRISKGAAYALAMRLHLYRGEFTEALAAARSIEGYSLFGQSGKSGYENYEGLFLLANQECDEYILNLENTENTHEMNFITFVPNSHGGWSGVVPLQSLVDEYETTEGLTIEEAAAAGKYDAANPYVNRDPRLRATIIYPGQNWEGQIFRSVESDSPDYPGSANNATHSGYNFKKYYNSLSQFPLTYENTAKSIPMFRYAEVLLTIAECKTELNEIDEELYSALDRVRRRAGMPVVDRGKYGSQAKLRELVRRERRVELAFEGLRRADLLRWNIATEVMNKPALGCNQGVILDEVSDPVFGDKRVKLNGEPFFVEPRSFKEHHVLFPIPLSEIDKNPKLAPNNPGYE